MDPQINKCAVISDNGACLGGGVYTEFGAAAGFALETDITSASMLFWLEAGDDLEVSAGVPATEGQRINRWVDKSTNENHWTQGTAARKPTFDADAGTEFNNGPACLFDEPTSDQWLEGPDLSLITEGEVFALLMFRDDPATEPASAGIWDMGDGTNAAVLWTEGTIYENCGAGDRYATGNPTDDMASSAIYNISSATNDWESRINGSSHHTENPNTVYFPAAPTLGKSATAGFIFDGWIAAFGMFDGKLSAGDRATVYAYLDALRS